MISTPPKLLDANDLANRPVFLTALEILRRLALAEQVLAPKQLELVLAELAEAS